MFIQGLQSIGMGRNGVGPKGRSHAEPGKGADSLVWSLELGLIKCFEGQVGIWDGWIMPCEDNSFWLFPNVVCKAYRENTNYLRLYKEIFQKPSLHNCTHTHTCIRLQELSCRM